MPGRPGPPGRRRSTAPPRPGRPVLHHGELDLRPRRVAVIERGCHGRAQKSTRDGSRAVRGAAVPGDGWKRAGGARGTGRTGPQRGDKSDRQRGGADRCHQSRVALFVAHHSSFSRAKSERDVLEHYGAPRSVWPDVGASSPANQRRFVRPRRTHHCDTAAMLKPDGHGVQRTDRGVALAVGTSIKSTPRAASDAAPGSTSGYIVLAIGLEMVVMAGAPVTGVSDVSTAGLLRHAVTERRPRPLAPVNAPSGVKSPRYGRRFAR